MPSNGVNKLRHAGCFNKMCFKEREEFGGNSWEKSPVKKRPKVRGG